ncbi:MAG: tyrosine-protein phosphatase [Candidatus Izemoplasmatales bacterium]
MMIDIHTHLLPFVDDGVRDYDEAIQIINDLSKQGVNDIFITPHYYKLRNYLSSPEENKQIFDTLKSKLDMNDIRLYLANEIKYTKDTLKDIEDKRVLALFKNFYLVEFSTDISVYELSEAIFNMIVKKYIPIIAHVERYENLNKIEDVKDFKKMGALIQVNATSLLGSRGLRTKKWIKKLIKEDLVDFVSSDSHRIHENLMKDAYQYLEKKFSKECAEKLMNNQIVIQA